MAQNIGSAAAEAGRRAAEIAQQQAAQRQREAAAQRQREAAAQANQRAATQTTVDKRSPSSSQPRAELFRADTFTPAKGRAPVQLDGAARLVDANANNTLALRSGEQLRRLSGNSLPSSIAEQLGRTAGEGVISSKAPLANEQVARLAGDEVGSGNEPRVDEQKVSEAEARVRTAGGTALADELRREDLSAEDKRALIDRIVTGPDADQILSNFDHAAEERNYDYDDAALVASAVADAHQHGVITDEDLRTLAEDLGPERSAEFAAQLALDPANTRAGGVVEAFGRQAQALGHEQAAAIAFSSSQELIEANLPSDEAQRAAFEDVRAYIDSQDRDDFSNEQQAFFTIAAGNAVRLSANGNGWNDSELQDFVKDLGPSLAGEVIARTRNTPGDSATGGAVEKLGLAAREIAGGDLSEEDKREWELNSAVALTASRELIDAHLQGPEALKAFNALSEAAYSQYDTARDAQEGGYNLLRFPEITEGAAALFEARTNEIVEASIRSGEGVLDEGDLDRFLQSTAFSPFTSPQVKQQVQEALTKWTENHVQIGDEHDEGNLSFEVGKVLGIVQNAADAAVDRVGDDEQARVEAENEAKGFIASLGSSVVGTALGAYNPLLGAVAGPVAQEIIEAVLPEEDVAEARAQAEEDFRNLLEEQGTSADLGQVLKETQERYLRRLQDAIANQLQRGDLTQEQRNQLEASALVLGNIQEGLDDGYSTSRPN